MNYSSSRCNGIMNNSIKNNKCRIIIKINKINNIINNGNSNVNGNRNGMGNCNGKKKRNIKVIGGREGFRYGWWYRVGWACYWGWWMLVRG